MHKIEEFIFSDSSGEFDHKNITNKSDYVISEDIIARIESGALNIEDLEQLVENSKIFKYKTQITIHGQFPNLNIRTFHYKNIFQNKNLSVGVRYSAIDMKKKIRIFKEVKKYSDYNYHMDSTEAYLYRLTIGDKEKVLEVAKQYMILAGNIDKSLFIGNVDVHAGVIPMLGYMAIVKIHINAVYEVNVDKLISNIHCRTFDEVKDIDGKLEIERLKEIEDNKIWEENRRKKIVEEQARIKIEVEQLKGKYEYFIPNKEGYYFIPQYKYDNTMEYSFYHVKKITDNTITLARYSIKNLDNYKPEWYEKYKRVDRSKITKPKFYIGG
jgi:hypothetical protein